MNPFLQQAPIPGVKKIITVGSGKGGVGKSTVAVNLAAALQKQGHKVGLLDADIYGPSIPRMLGLTSSKPETDGKGKIFPVRGFGMNIMSMGFLVPEASALVWRGPMLFKAMDQLLHDVLWGELDYLIVDLPPGTGDVALTLAQKVPIHGAVVVCTPQNVALTDAKKAMDMFERISIPLLGVVENMAYMVGEKGEKIQLFPRGELDQYLDVKKIPKLGQVPFYPEVGVSCEAGVPVVESHSGDEVSEAFNKLAYQVAGRIKEFSLA